MRLTSDTLFHFTKSLSNLESILSNKFKLSYCKEEISFSESNHNHYFPMVTFCDIPLSLANEHRKKYGNYAIGLSKDWGIKNKLNPVIYIEKNSLMAEDLSKSIKILKSIPEIRKGVDVKNKNIQALNIETTNFVRVHLNMIRYCKNYLGDLNRNGKTKKNYRFYDEREWRYIPAWDNKENIKGSLTKEQYDEYRGDISKSKPFLKEITLDFNASDIKYIIVKSERDIPKMIRLISSIKGLTTNGDETDILSTKILTVDQLNQDF